jgi:hypothetical protein
MGVTMALKDIGLGAVQSPAPPAWKELSIPGSTDKIALIDPDLGPLDRPFCNLLRRNAENRIVWVAPLPEPYGFDRSDSYVGVDWENGLLAANTWSGYRVSIDPETGVITAGEFAK